ncbi:hypothetical protein JCGZ_21672 [Jatropha curcas]|uniref:Prolamin-like domain-containing protein n=1 Tax=Jatropha curcas TaxID=180498 RepID=A0A067JBN2_JATCU|nr:egg cell-secreted protein 1.1 [Jatropha curcas]KDP21201.1 hypothetical protein JCGZ_21672 [Jatropha curcas]
MAYYPLKFLLFVAILATSLDYFNFSSARPLSSSSNLMARLKLDEESPNCWDSLIQLQACSGEIVMFFLNGETYLGHSCCHAIRIISEQCWPNLVDTIGFTDEEGDILEGYCIKEEAGNSDTLLTPPPPPHVVPNKVVP